MAGPQAGMGVQPDEASLRRCRGPAPGPRAMRSNNRAWFRGPGLSAVKNYNFSRKVLLVFCFHYKLGPATGKTAARSREMPGPQRNQPRPPRPRSDP